MRRGWILRGRGDFFSPLIENGKNKQEGFFVRRRRTQNDGERQNRRERAQSFARLVFWGDVAFGELGAFAEEILFHLLGDDFLRIGIERIEAEFVHQHL